MQPRFETIPDKKIIGKKVKMSLVENRTFELWQSFMPQRKNILNSLNTDLFSISCYPDLDYFERFNPYNTFEKCAGVEVADFDSVSDEFEKFTLPGGLYAVFDYKGLPSDTKIFNYIYSEWLPNSDYVLDNRPHFEILGNKYKNNDPDSEEEIWIPVLPKI